MRYIPLLMLFVVSCCKPVDLKKEEVLYNDYIKALPDLKIVSKDAPLVLKVHYVEKAGLLALDTEDRDSLYRLTEDLTRTALGYEIKFEETLVFDAPKYLKVVKSRFNESPIRFPALAYLISWFSPERDKAVGDAISSALKGEPQERLKTYLGDDASTANVTKNFLKNLSAIYAEADLDRHPLLSERNKNDEALFSYGHWSTILQGEHEADFILTNTGIIGADTGMPLYVIARGGVTSAFVENNAFRPYQGVGVIGLYPFLAEGEFFNAKRGRLTKEQKFEAIAWVWVHELGHLLMKKVENYTLEDSVHRAAPNLRYYDWVKKIRETKNHHSDKVGVLKKF